MSPAPRRDTAAGRAYNDVRNLARANGRDPAEYMALYALEGFLARLAESPAVDDFVLKGGVLLAAFAARRPTRDIDFAASGFPNDVPDVEHRVAAVAALPMDDGLTFDIGSVRGEPIRDDAQYAGVRVHLQATLATARVPMHVDVNFGDPIWPAPRETVLPRLLGGEIRLQGYPAHMVLAEKIVTAVDRGRANTRWRDFVDIDAIAGATALAGSELTAAIGVVAAHREVPVVPLSDVLDGMAAVAQRRWAAWRRKQGLLHVAPENFQDLLDRVVAFADPALEGTVRDLYWDPSERSWARV